MPRKKNIKNSFSKAATTYDNYAVIQKIVAQRLISHVNKNKPYKNIVELGSGTGYYSGLLREQFNDANILSIDISEKMTEIAGRKNPSIRLINTDIETLPPVFFADFDLVTSNGVIHWLNNPRLFIKNLKEIKKTPKDLVLSIFGNKTLSELQCFIEYPMASASFLSKNQWENFLIKIFPCQFTLISETIHKTYPDLMTLLRSLKYTGVTVRDNKKFIWNRGFIKDTEEKFISKYLSITVSYEVFFVKINLSSFENS